MQVTFINKLPDLFYNNSRFKAKSVTFLSIFSPFNMFFNKRGIGVFGFTVVIFEIGFSVFALKISGFSVLVSAAVFVFFRFLTSSFQFS